MKRALISCVLVFSALGLAGAATRGVNDEARPSLDLKAAIECAEKFAKEERIDLSKYFLFSVNLVTKPGTGRDFEWRVVWDQPQHAADDEIELAVQMDKKVARLFRG